MTQSSPPVVLPYGPPITLRRATLVAAAAETEAERQGWQMIIAIVDSAGHLVLFRRMDQAQLGSIEMAQRKAETAVAFRRPTLSFEQRLAEGGATLRMLAMDILPVEGGLPLIRDGVLIGAIGVSGMLSSEDAAVASAGAAALLDVGSPG